MPFYGLSTAHGRARGAFALSARLWAAFSCQLVFSFSVREKSVIMDIMRADYINPAVYGRVYHILTYENALALRTSLETGLRISDVLALEVQNFHGNSFEFTASKTGKKGRKTISADLARRLRQISGEKWVFTGRFGDKPRTRQAVWKDVKKAAAALKISENLSTHSARKTYAVETFHNEGFSKTQKELQHSRADTTMLYAFSDILTGGRRGSDERIDEILRLVREIHSEVVGRL